jgi:hypothetical protein
LKLSIVWSNIQQLIGDTLANAEAAQLMVAFLDGTLAITSENASGWDEIFPAFGRPSGSGDVAEHLHF